MRPCDLSVREISHMNLPKLACCFTPRWPELAESIASHTTLRSGLVVYFRPQPLLQIQNTSGAVGKRHGTGRRGVQSQDHKSSDGHSRLSCTIRKLPM